MDFDRNKLHIRREARGRSAYALDEVVQHLAEADGAGARRAWALAVAVTLAAHVLVFLVVFPESDVKPAATAADHRLYVLRQVKLVAPQPAQALPSVPRPSARAIPMPDVSPDDPEPDFHDTAQETLQVALPGIESVASIPEGPPVQGIDAYELNGDISPPERLYAPGPSYPEAARHGRIQGSVILRTIIDAFGNVAHIQVLRGLPMGLTEAAVEAVEAWRFRPAIRQGEPVPVYFLVTVTFSIQ